jgi:nucleotide-binding universal stress UspA family protein
VPKLELIVVGVDFSELALEALGWVARHLAPDAELALVHVLETPSLSPLYRTVLPPRDELVEMAREPAREELKKVAASLNDRRLTTEVRTGRPDEELADVAEERGADLIVIGEHGRYRGPGGGLGSTAEPLLHRSPAPVLIARNLPEGVPRRILLPLEESEAMDRVLDWARFLVERFDAEAVAIHVLTQILHAHLRLVSTPRKADEAVRAAGAEVRRWIGEILESAGFPAGTVVECPAGQPGRQIVAAADRHRSELIVMGSRAAGAVGRALVGSVAGAVLRDAACSVLVVPTHR